MPNVELRLGDLERKYLEEVLQSQFRNSRSGGMIRRLEERFAAAFGVRYAIALCNGTATLHTALGAFGIGPGDEVIVPPLTMMSTTFCVFHAGATPVYADVDPRTFTIDPAGIEALITPRTRAIIPVSLYGCPPDMAPIWELARKHRLHVLEDNAQCFLGKYRGKILGSVSDMSSYSFQISKHLAAGEGGMIITDSEDLALKARRFSCLGYGSLGAAAGKSKIARQSIQDPGYERHVSIGWNYRMPEPAAAIALAQTERIDELVELRRRNAGVYAQALGNCRWLSPQAMPPDSVHTYWTYALKLDRDDIPWRQWRDRYVESGGDGVYAAWQINYLEPVLRGKKIGSQTMTQGLCPVAESLQPRLFQLKTNYFDSREAERQGEALAKTIKSFGA
jgi:perosamine synthetase